MIVNDRSIKLLTCVLVYNNGKHVNEIIAKFPAVRGYDVVFNDDGSTDDTARYLNHCEFQVLRNKSNNGVGSSIKKMAKYALENGYDVLVIMAGNGKDNPEEITRLLDPIVNEGYDYVQGSRYLPGGQAKNLPLFRRVMVRVHALVFRLLTGFPCTDALNGFRAYSLRILFDDPRINVWQDWLDRYEYETYLHYKVLTLGYKVKEVPVTKSYTGFEPGAKYSHIRPFVDWWSIMRPILLLWLGLRK